jgi:predicted TPR repeat methyltransferase
MRFSSKEPLKMETISELRRKAAELAGAGKQRNAAQLYEQILRSPDRDGDTALRLGALQRKFHDVAAAVASFELAGKLFRREGQLSKADATERLIAEARMAAPSAAPRGWRRLFSFPRWI